MTRAHQSRRKKRKDKAKDKAKRARRKAMSGNNANAPTSRLVRPDGLPTDTETITLKLWEVEYPLPTVDPKVLMGACMQDVQVQDPVTGATMVVSRLAMPAQVALLLVETVRALEQRDKRIEALEEALAELTRRFEDPAEHDKKEGYDGVE